MLRSDTIKELPLEMIVNIFSFMRPLDLLILDLVCKDTYNLFNNEHFWKSILVAHFPDSLVTLSERQDVDYKFEYKHENYKVLFPLLYSTVTETYACFRRDLMSIKQKDATERLLINIDMNKAKYSLSRFSLFYTPTIFRTPTSKCKNTSNAAMALRDVILGLKDKSILSEYSEILHDNDQFEPDKKSLLSINSLSGIYNELVNVKLISEVKPKDTTEALSDDEDFSMQSLSLY